MRAGGSGLIAPPDDWKPDHFLVAALLRCTLGSLRHHARLDGIESSGRGAGHALVTRRVSDGRYAVVEIEAVLEVALEPDPGPDAAAALLAKAERDCFVGNSLTAKPSYRWTVNGAELRARAAPS